MQLNTVNLNKFSFALGALFAKQAESSTSNTIFSSLMQENDFIENSFGLDVGGEQSLLNILFLIQSLLIGNNINEANTSDSTAANFYTSSSSNTDSIDISSFDNSFNDPIYQEAKENLLAQGYTKTQVLRQLNGLIGTKKLENIANYKYTSIVEEGDVTTGYVKGDPSRNLASAYEKAYNKHMLESAKGGANSSHYKDLATLDLMNYNRAQLDQRSKKASADLMAIERINKKLKSGKIDKAEAQKEIQKLEQQINKQIVEMEKYEKKMDEISSNVTSSRLQKNAATLVKTTTDRIEGHKSKLQESLNQAKDKIGTVQVQNQPVGSQSNNTHKPTSTKKSSVPAAPSAADKRRTEIEQVYKDVLGRNSDSGGMDYYANSSKSIEEIKKDITWARDNNGAK